MFDPASLHHGFENISANIQKGRKTEILFNALESYHVLWSSIMQQLPRMEPLYATGGTPRSLCQEASHHDKKYAKGVASGAKCHFWGSVPFIQKITKVLKSVRQVWSCGRLTSADSQNPGIFLDRFPCIDLCGPKVAHSLSKMDQKQSERVRLLIGVCLAVHHFTCPWQNGINSKVGVREDHSNNLLRINFQYLEDTKAISWSCLGFHPTDSYIVYKS